jgi:carboxypeptidase D
MLPALLLLLLVAVSAAGASIAAPRALLARADPRDPAGGGASAAVAAATARYHDNEELEAALRDFASRCSAVARLESIGTSAEGRPIWALEISDRPGTAEAEPAVKFVGGVHGDEPTGRVLALALAEWLCAERGRDADAKRIVNDMHLWLVPAMNPDGFAARRRGNAANRDLNRDFPDRFTATGGALAALLEASGGEQPETAAVMAWTRRVGFAAGASFHEGALVANYPYDGTPNKTTEYTACPDDATFRVLATAYARAHASMALPTNREFPAGGTTNGAAWYPIYGSMQDWNYLAAGCLELTLELSLGKWPPAEGLPALFEANRAALVQFALQAGLGGVRGRVLGEAAGGLRGARGAEAAPLAAAVAVVGGGPAAPARLPHGAFARPLAPGTYELEATAEGFLPARARVVVPEGGVGVRHDFVLRPLRGGGGGGGAGAALRPGRPGHGALALVAVGVAFAYLLWRRRAAGVASGRLRGARV